VSKLTARQFQPGFTGRQDEVRKDIDYVAPATFPVTPVLDDFNRADGAVGGNWTTPIWAGGTNDRGLDIVSGVVLRSATGATANGSGYLSGIIYGPQEIYATINNLTSGHWLYLCLTNFGSDTESCYSLQIDQSFTLLRVARKDFGSSNTLVSFTSTIALNDVIGMRLAQGVIYVYQNGVLKFRVAESTYNYGQLGIELDGAAASLDNVGGGAVGLVPQARQVNFPLPVGDGSTNYRDTILGHTPSLYWRLGEASGTVANDISGHNNVGAYVASPTLGVAGALASDADTAVTFDGTSQYVSSSYSPFTTGTVRTFEAWVKRTSQAAADAIMASSAGSGIFEINMATGSDTLTFTAGDVTYANFTNSGVGTGSWHHVVVKFDDPADTVDLWVDGIRQTQITSYTGVFNGTPGTFKVAAAYGTTADGWIGSIDEVAVYEYGLTSDQIYSHYQAGIARLARTATRQQSIMRGANF
jgi:hypothetical protein